VANLQNHPGGSMAAPGRPGCPYTAGLLLLLALSMPGRTRPFSAYPSTGVVLVSIRFSDTSPLGRSCTSSSWLSRSPLTDFTGKKASLRIQGQPEKGCSSRWAMCLPRGTAIRDCESRSKTPTRSVSQQRDLLLLGPAPMQAGMFLSKGIRWVQL
jgi:hypothetical protein